MASPVEPPDTSDLVGHHSRFFRLSQDCLIISRFDGTILDVNPAYERVFGYSLAELRTMHTSDMFHPDDFDRIMAQRERVRAGEDTTWFIARFRTKSGDARLVEWMTTSSIDDQLIYAQGRDITDRDRMVRDLARSEAQFRTLFESSPVGMAIAGSDFRYVMTNGQFRSMLGRDEEDLRALTIGDVTHPDDYVKNERLLRELLDRKIDRFEIEKRYRRKDETFLWVRNTATLLSDVEEGPALIVSISEDISERKQFDTFKDSFIASAAHELRSPVTAISGFASMLASQGAEMTAGERGAAEAAILRQSVRLRDLVSTMLDFARIDQGRIELHVERVLVADVVSRSVDAAPPPDGASVAVAVPDGLAVTADAERLVQVISNLLSNAYKYGGPSIEISAAPSDDGVEVAVSDDGDGIPDELLAEMFEPFRRAAHLPGHTGSGLGLAIVRMLVQALGGMIRYEPNKPRGARFVVTLQEAE